MLEADVALNLGKTHQRLGQMMGKKVGEYGLSFRLLHILVLIEKNPGVNQKEIAAQLRFTQGAMSGYVKRLTKLKMLDQKPLGEDMRYKQLVITDHGRCVIEDYENEVHLRYREVFVGFNEIELEKFNASLVKIIANLEQIDPEMGQ